ncbi:hypothetical protein ACIBBD_08125 [Streptomyces sp. NPDC051315]|uniref:hypothetical protein n=1 Tax=Streptomyces sp. NPDC051315 TaxID=3365650 RepID=UPI0037983E53
MTSHRTHWTGRAALTATACALPLCACSDETDPSSVASRAASAAESVGDRAASAFASASAEAGRRLDSIKGGVDAKADVRLGTPSTDADGRTTVDVTATNPDDSAKSFTVQVDFKDPDGTWRDTVLVTVPDVPPKASRTSTARSTHKLPKGTQAEVPRAVRH